MAAAPAPQNITPDDIAHRFTNHPPRTEGIGYVLDALTAHFIDLGKVIVAMVPPGRETSLAITALEECSMWTKAAVARNQDRLLGESDDD